jgi:hypothetical protein
MRSTGVHLVYAIPPWLVELDLISSDGRVVMAVSSTHLRHAAVRHKTACNARMG